MAAAPRRAWLGLALVPGGHQLLGVLEDRSDGGQRFLLGLLPAPVLHFALVESHGRIVPAGGAMSTRNPRIQFYVENPKGPASVPALPQVRHGSAPPRRKCRGFVSDAVVGASRQPGKSR
jgi:hypothetical protein